MLNKNNYYEPLLMTLLRFGDSFLGAFLFAGVHWILSSYSSEITFATILFFFLSIVFFTYSGVYRSWRIGSLIQEINQIVLTCIFIYFAFIAISYLLKMSNFYSREAVFLWIILWPSLLTFQRIFIRKFLRHYRKKGINLKHVIIIGNGKLGHKIIEWIENNPWSGTVINGFFHESNMVSLKGYKNLGDYDKITDYLKENKVDIAYILLSNYEGDKIHGIIADLSNSTCSVYLIPDISFPFIHSVNITYLDNIPILSLANSPIRGINALIKQAEDIFFGTLFLLLASPVMLVIAIAIKLTSSGPVIFKQWRYGLHGKRMQVWKFRTMNVCEDGYEFKQATQNDPRLTRIGAYLRKTSLDELPQFINVLQGRLSIVGPRPHAVEMNERYREEIKGYMLRHKIKPGITGLAQVKGYRGETDSYEKIKKRTDFDLQYINDWSLFLDIKIMFKTIFIILKEKNAY